jgi:Methyltransferase FkbM domain
LLKVLRISIFCHFSLLVEKLSLRCIDFVKLAIEGAELNVLKGAYKTISRFSQNKRLPFIIVQNVLIQFQDFLNDLGLGYKFYLSHATIHSEEAMLFANVDD